VAYQLGLCESSFLRIEYSMVDFLIEYFSTRLVLEVAINYRVAQNARIFVSK